MITWPLLKRAVMFCCFLAVLLVGAKQQHGSFLQGWREKEGQAEEWGGELERGGAESVRLWGQGPEGRPCGLRLGPGPLPF